MRILLLIALLFAAGCTAEAPPAPGTATAHLSPAVPDTTRTLRWSPKGEQLPLRPDDEAFLTELSLGPTGTPPLALRFEKSPGQAYFDRLTVDFDRDGHFEDEETLTTTPSETRGKWWSSFDTVVDVPVLDPETGKTVMNAYPLAFWYVEDPREAAPEQVLRFSRRGWMEGRTRIDGIDALILVTESKMDGVFDLDDYWALALPDSAATLLSYTAARPATRHAWLGENAYRIEELDPSGRRLTLIAFDPGMTRDEEREIDDHLAVDRRAPHSGREVAFGHDFAAAEQQARDQGKRLFIDFETTWCGPCKTMDEWVYTADAVVDAAAEGIAVKVDGDDHPDLVDRFAVTGYPTMILVAPDGTVMRQASGYQNVEAMTAFLQ